MFCTKHITSLKKMKIKRINHTTSISNVLVIGSGGAGLRAAIEARFSGVEITVIGKRIKEDVHTVLAAGGINICIHLVCSYFNISQFSHYLINTHCY